MTKCTRLLTFCVAVLLTASQAPAQFIARDPGPRGGPAGAGGTLPGLSTGQIDVFNAGRNETGNCLSRITASMGTISANGKSWQRISDSP